MRSPSRHLARSAAAVGLALAFLAPALIPLSGAQTAAPPLKHGMDYGSMKRAIELGLKPDYASYWIGPWTRNDWNGVNAYLNATRAAGVTPFIQWYYWGDDISPSCVENGCGSALHSTLKTPQEWNSMLQRLADAIRRYGGGREVIVSVETEFNKNGVDSLAYAPTFDGHLVRHMQTLEAVPGVKTVIAFGNWGHDKWSRFPKAIAEADMMGFQAMAGSTRDTLPRYMGNAASTLETARHIQSTYGKPSLLTDLAVSSWKEPLWQLFQDQAIRTVLSQERALADAGLRGIVYRSLVDVPMDIANYFGIAEQHWGLSTGAGVKKLSYDSWRATVNGQPLPTPARPVPQSLEAEAFYHRPAGGYVSDPTASNIFGWRIAPGGEAGESILVPARANYEFRLQAKAAQSTPARVSVLVDGQPVYTGNVGSAWAPLVGVATLEAGTHQVRVRYDEQAPSDRGLVLDWMGVATTTAPATTPPVSNVTRTLHAISTAASNVTATHCREGERMATRTAGGQQPSTASSGGAHWNLWANGYLEDRYQVYANGSYEVRVTGRGELAGGVAPRLAVSVGGRDVGVLDLTGTSLGRYTLVTQLTTGSYPVRLTYANDAVVGTQDRNAIVDVACLVPR